jgi:hypothetical protein
LLQGSRGKPKPPQGKHLFSTKTVCCFCGHT